MEEVQTAAAVGLASAAEAAVSEETAPAVAGRAWVDVVRARVEARRVQAVVVLAVSMVGGGAAAALGARMAKVVGGEGRLASVRVVGAELAGGEAASTPTWPGTR